MRNDKQYFAQVILKHVNLNVSMAYPNVCSLEFIFSSIKSRPVLQNVNGLMNLKINRIKVHKCTNFNLKLKTNWN